MRSIRRLLVIAGLAVPVSAHAQDACQDAPGPVSGILYALRGPVTLTPEQKATALCGEERLGAISVPGIPAPPADAGHLVIVNKGPTVGEPGVSSVMLLDLSTGKMGSTTLTQEQGPHEIAVSPDGKTGVAPNYGLAPQGERPLPGEGKSLTVIDFASGKQRTLPLADYSRPHGNTFLDDDRVAVTCDGKGTDLTHGYVLVVNVHTGAIEQSFPTGQAGTHLVRASADGTRLFVTNIQGQSFQILDRATGSVLKTLHTGKGAEGFDLSPDGRTAWVANQEEGVGTISVIDLSTLEKVTTFAAPGGPIRVKFTADGSKVMTSDRAGNSMTVYDAQSHATVAKVSFDVPQCDPTSKKPLFGKSSVPMAIVAPPGSPYVYVPNSHSELITAVDTRTWTIAGYYKAGTKPDPMAWYPDEAHPLAAYPHLAEKYPHLTGGAVGTYSGAGQGKSWFEIPRRVDPVKDGTKLASSFPAVYPANLPAGSMPVPAFLDMIEATVPAPVRARIDAAIAEAKRLGEADPPTAAPFPYAEEKRLRHTMLFTYLHSRDLTVIQSAMGYPLFSTGIHDQMELARGKYLKQTLAKKKDAWFVNYVNGLGDEEEVNVAFLNPHWIADIYRWTPDESLVQNAMDAHRLSDHHNGNPQHSWDPVESAINNVYHRRELYYGVRKEASMSWVDLGRKMENDAEAAIFIKSGVGVPLARDVAALMQQLEREGKIVPWSAAGSGSPDAEY